MHIIFGKLQYAYSYSNYVVFGYLSRKVINQQHGKVIKIRRSMKNSTVRALPPVLGLFNFEKHRILDTKTEAIEVTMKREFPRISRGSLTMFMNQRKFHPLFRNAYYISLRSKTKFDNVQIMCGRWICSSRLPPVNNIVFVM